MRRTLLRDVALLGAAAALLGTVVNLVPGRQLPWWGQGDQPPQVGVDFQWLDPISADALRTALPTVVFLDTRGPAAWELGHVPGAVGLAFTDVDHQLTPELMDDLRLADAVILYGDADEGDVEQLLAQELRRRGLPPPHVLLGGYPTWEMSGLPTESEHVQEIEP